MRKIPLLAAALALLLAACGGAASHSGEAAARQYVQGALDMTYLGQWGEEYLRLVGRTAEECRADYETGLKTEAAYFARYFASALTPEAEEAVLSLYRQVYASARYQVLEVTETQEGYTAQVQVEPMDLMEALVTQELGGCIRAFNDRFRAGEFDGLDRQGCETQWLLSLVQAAQGRLARLEHRQAQTLSLRIQADGAGNYALNREDLAALDAQVLPYPALEDQEVFSLFSASAVIVVPPGGDTAL